MNETGKGVELNWCGQPIRPGESYGGRSENIPEGCPPVLGDPRRAPARDRREVVREGGVAAVFKGGPLAKNPAARQVGASTGASPAPSYPALDEKRGFPRHPGFENGKVSWR